MRRSARRDSKRTTRDATADGPCPPARAARRAALTQGRGVPVGERARAPTEEAHPPNRERRGRPLAGVASSCPRRPPPLGLEVARATVAAPPTDGGCARSTATTATATLFFIDDDDLIH